MTAPFCIHLPTQTENPLTALDAFDNLTLLLSHVEALFYVMSEAQHDVAVSHIASLGEALCVELRRRASVLLARCTPETPETLSR